MAEEKNRGARSQTLDRALDALELLADGHRRTSQELADELGLHRSIVYRMLRTFEDHGFVARVADGRYTVGLGVAALADAGIVGAESRIGDVLEELANASGATALLSVPQKDHAVVLAAARPSGSTAAVAIRRSTRLPLDRGAPGLAILALEAPRPYEPDEAVLARTTGYVHSKGAPFPGFDAVARPVRLEDGQSASISVVFPNAAVGLGEALPPLRHAVARIEHPDDLWTV
ncbi:helix-turn-helix domain-containing protein [Leucobacter allii]|uniref:Helix-turn-helix domain-containing protein n=1 Tax=Leucobacter allii TaxID=2932247 RepID=A0ABY4FKM3_9MICO|nr:helix-turn-helix domain-containing protein [Leucobacter allii]UOQ56681.1 helix-turn-helix domain-containing protein [Leucobacter allii]